MVYSSFLASHPPIRTHDGFLYLRRKARRLVLIDGEGSAVDARFLKVNEVIRSGSVIHMHCHCISVGDRDLDLPEPCNQRHDQQDPVVAVSYPSHSPPPNPRIDCSSAPAPPSLEAIAGASMANFVVGPTSFLPGDYEVLHVDGCPQQCRYHVAGAITPRHEDLAIASILPDFPGDQPFALTRNFLLQFMEEETPITLQISQRCPLGSAYVRVGAMADRDWLVARSPHQFMGRQITFVEHNRGRNHRAFTYNRECWLMLLAFPANLWTDEHIRGAVKDFGAMITWDKELSSYAALIVKFPFTFLARDCWVKLLQMKMCLQLMDQPHTLCLLHLSNNSRPLLKEIMAGHNANAFNLNDMPVHGMPELNALPHQLNADDFLELNDLINPVHQDAVNLQDEEMQDLQALVNPVIQNALANGLLNEEQAADNQTKLLSPKDFDWAKSLMQSKIWQILSEFDSQQNNSSMDFVLPLHCPASEPPHCSLSSDATQGFSTPQAIKLKILLAPPASTSVVHIRKKARATPLCVSEVRRSPRISDSTKGYKAKTYFDKNCLACASVAPPIKKAVVRNLCTKFSISAPDSDEESPPKGPNSRQTRSTKEKKKSTKKEANDEASKAKKK
ncbi:hypothetical protein ACQ4PT_050661 [Festuca glaucescens]